MPKTNRTDKVDRFVECYLVHLNATQAYKDSHPGVADGTARTEGCRLLANPEVADKIAAAKAERSRRTQISQDRVLRAIARQALIETDMLTFARWDANGVELKNSEVLKKRQGRAVASVSAGQFGPKIKLRDPTPALRLLLEHVNQTGGDGKNKPTTFVELMQRALELKKKRDGGDGHE